MDCPDGHGPMNTEQLDDVEIDVCQTCGGIWLDNGELKRLLNDQHVEIDDQTRKQLKQLRAGKPKIDWSEQRLCPVCGEKMRQTNYSYSSHVIIDHCDKHGVWLDSGEIELLEAFSEGGRKLMDMAGEAYAEMAASRARSLNLIHGINETRYNSMRFTKRGKFASMAWITAYLLGDR
ncbi:MAG: zf-TFIIB domain-containing protein [Candidatus Alcyoniella australis]|nr:zf-TFIIB domain-containing protein [Candidatus Alcyoniella australis]